MNAASISARIGTLALALAVGVVVTGGVASATEGTGDTGPSSPGSSSQSSQDAGTKSSETNAGTNSETDSGTKESTKSEPDTEVAKDEPDDTAAATKEPEAEPEAPAPSEEPTVETEAPEPTTESSAVPTTPEPTPTETAVETEPAAETPSSQAPQATAESAPTKTSAAPAPADVVTPTTSTRATAAKTPEPKTKEPTPTASARTLEAVAEDTETPARTTAEPSTKAVALSVADTAVTPVTQHKSLLAGVVEAVGAIVNSVVTGVLGLFGITPTASGLVANNPLAAAVISLLGWGARRETIDGETSVASSQVATALAVSTAAAVAAPTTIQVAWLTGSTSINNTMARFGIFGTDLGIMWDNGVTGDDPTTPIVEQHQVLIAFGDTFTNAAMTTGWRSNVLLRSADNVLSDGIKVPNGIVDPGNVPVGAYSGAPMSTTTPNYAREIIGKYPYTWWTQVTTIPTGAISIPGAGVNGATRQYIAYMSVNQWGWPGSWTTNYSAIAYSDDNGQNWRNVPQSSVRSGGWLNSTVPYVSGNEHFQMVSFVKPPEDSADAAAGYVYAYGTPSGRSGTVYLSRVQSTQILDVSKYQYWTGSTWVNNSPSSAKPVLPGTTSSFLGLFKWTTYPSAGELSVQYNDYLKKYVMLYTDSANNVQLRTSDAPNGTWSAPTTLVTSAKYPGLYAPMIHPWSGTSQLRKSDGSAEDPQYLYWNMSLWGNYNVTLMRTDLSSLLTVV